MNHIFKNSIFIILIALAISSCRPEKFKEIGDIPSKTKGLQDDWKLAHAYVVDEAFSTPDKLDITEFYATKTLPTITFTENTFTALTAGTVKNYFGTGSGTWSFDNVDFPTSLFFKYSDNTIDTFLLGSTIRPIDTTLKLKKTFYYTKNGKRNIAYSYIWEFIRIQ